MIPEPDSLSVRLKAQALRLGFDMVGIAPAVSPPGYAAYEGWLRDGHAAGMAYMHRQAEARSHPDRVMEGVRSVVVCGMVYGKRGQGEIGPNSGKIARYARGADYHDVLWRRLEDLLRWIEAEWPGLKGRAVADTAPLLERDFARMAGLGWIGKNTMLINRKLGSFTVLGALLVDLELSYDQPHSTGHCGTCTRCLDLCPTDAIAGPYRLDASKCLSYWTIEHRGAIPDPMAEQLDGWAFGCDICQDVCPWNRKAPDGREPSLQARPEFTSPDLIEWLRADPDEFRRRMRRTALSRARRSGLLRNAALILGQRRCLEAESALIALLSDDDPVIRGASAWALGRLDTEGARRALRDLKEGPA